jgi:hypothetical protein
MARTPRAATAITNAGLVGTYTAADQPNGETMPYGAGHRVLHVKNGGGGSTVVTVTDDVASGDAARPTVTITAGTDQFILLQEASGGKLQGGGNVLIDYSVGTSVTAAAYDIAAE